MGPVNVSAVFILRPIATSLLMLLVLILGLAAYALLPIAALPQVDLPTIQISASLPGAFESSVFVSRCISWSRKSSFFPTSDVAVSKDSNCST